MCTRQRIRLPPDWAMSAVCIVSCEQSVDNEIHVVGGLDRRGSLVKDVHAFDLKTNIWHRVEYEGRFEGRAYFPASVVLVSTHNFTRTFYRARIPVEGIYIFGGVTNEGVNEHLSVLTKRNSKYYYQEMRTSGKGPCGRYQHTMNYCAALNILVVYGGRNETMIKSGKSTPMLNDMYVLAIDIMTWTEIEINGELPLRTLHAADVVSDKLLVFGGVNENTINSKVGLVVKFEKYKKNLKSVVADDSMANNSGALY